MVESVILENDDACKHIQVISLRQQHEDIYILLSFTLNIEK